MRRHHALRQGTRHKSDRVDWLTDWLMSLSLHLCCRCLLLRPGCSLTIDVARSELVRATLMLWSNLDGGHMAISRCSPNILCFCNMTRFAERQATITSPTLGLPVVPEVYTSVARLSGRMAARSAELGTAFWWSRPQPSTSSKDSTGQSSASAAAADTPPHSTTTNASFCEKNRMVKWRVRQSQPAPPLPQKTDPPHSTTTKDSTGIFCAHKMPVSLALAAAADRLALVCVVRAAAVAAAAAAVLGAAAIASGPAAIAAAVSADVGKQAL